MERDSPQGEAAQRFFGTLSPATPGFVSREVVVELAWLLERTFKLRRVKTHSVMLGLLKSRELIVEQRENLGMALGEFERGGPGLADQLIRIAAIAAGCDGLVTFDKDLAREPGVTLLA